MASRAGYVIRNDATVRAGALQGIKIYFVLLGKLTGTR